MQTIKSAILFIQFRLQPAKYYAIYALLPFFCLINPYETLAQAGSNNSTPALLKENKRKDLTKDLDYSRPKRRQERKPSSNSSFNFTMPLWVNIVLFSIFGLFILYLVWVIVKRGLTNISVKEKNELRIEGFEEQIDEDTLHQIDFDQEIRRALGQKNYLMVIRFYYLKTLQVLSNAKLIKVKTSKTNRDYVEETTHTPIAKEFQKMTQAFNQSWYGDQQVEEQQFYHIEKKLKNLFDSITNQLGKGFKS